MYKYDFTIDEKMKELINLGLVKVKAYEDNGYGMPFVEIQTDLEKTDIDLTEFVGKYHSYEEANENTLKVARILGIKADTIKVIHHD